MSRAMVDFAVWLASTVRQAEEWREERAPTNAIVDAVEHLARVSRALHRHSERLCSEEGYDTPKARSTADSRRDGAESCIVRLLGEEWAVKRHDDPCGPSLTIYNKRVGVEWGKPVPRLVVYLAHFDRCVRYQRPTALTVGISKGD